MSVAIIGGTGDEGFALALRLAHAGEHVVIGSRAEERGRAAADKALDVLGASGAASGLVEGTTNEAAAAGSDVVLVTVPYAGQADIYRAIKEALRPGAIVCDTTTPLATAVGGRAWHVLTPWSGSAAEDAKAILPSGARLVAGFHTVSAEALRDLDHTMQGDVLLCGNDAEAKATIGGLVEKIRDLRWIDTGALSMARIVEPLTALMISVNRTYGTHETGVALTGRASWGGPPPKERKRASGG